MRTLFFWTVGALVFGSFVACVGDAPATSGAAQGANGGSCFANGTCNPGLSCDPATNTCGVGGDASSSDAASDAGTTDSGSTVDESGVLSCPFNTTFYPCTSPQNSCYGDTFSCSASGCGGPNDTLWSCFSPNQCSTNLPCCLPIAGNSLHAGSTCAEGSLTIGGDDAGGFEVVAQCGSAVGPCPADQYQLCQTNKQCPTGQRCNLVKVTGRVTLDSPDGGPSSSVDIGACVPQ